MPRKPTVASAAEPLAEHSSLLTLLATNERLQQGIEAYLREKDQWLEERAWLRAMIDQVPDYLFVKDRECRFVVANTSVAADLGLHPHDLIGKTDLELHSPEVAPRFYNDDRTVMNTGVAMLDIEEFVILKSGQRRWLSTSKLPFRGADGKIIGLVGIARDITERKRAEDHVRYLAFHDPLTNLPNRAHFETSLRTMSEALKGKQEAALLFIDLDRFKHVNDTLGHLAGDELIRQVAARLSRLVGQGDLVARLGGDEFAVLIANESEQLAARTLCEFILSELKVPFDLFGDAAHIGASIGVARITRNSAVEQVLREADIALYEAKAKGRGCWQAFEGEMATALQHRRAIEQDLRSALETEDQLALAYQPVYAADARTIVGAEALVRWRHPTRGLLSPELFIGVAEERGLIEKLGNWVLEEACAFLRGTELPWVAVNVSPVQLRNPAFADRVLAIVEAAGLAPSRLQIEITEGVLLEKSESGIGMLRALREAGIQIAIDDFGTGYSSLNYLRRYNIDKLKVDRSFVALLGTSKGADAIVRAIVSLARAMDLKVTAEGVETRQQRDHLAALGCHELQGYLLSRPVPAADLLALLKPVPASNTAG